jgi:hypothetical protein
MALWAPLLSLSTLALSGCGGKGSAASRNPELAALDASLQDPERLQQRLEGVKVQVPGTDTRVALAGGRAFAPAGDWTVEMRSVVGTVPVADGIDAYVDLAVHRKLKAPEAYLALIHLTPRSAEHAATAPIGEGAKLLGIAAQEVRGTAYELKVDYLDRAPQGTFEVPPTYRKKKLLHVSRHSFAP